MYVNFLNDINNKLENALIFYIIYLLILGLILVSIRRIARGICYQGGVCNFLNQLQTNINAKTFNRAKASLANFAAAVKAPAFAVA